MLNRALTSSSVGSQWSPTFDGSDTSSTDTVRDRSLLGVPVSVKGKLLRRLIDILGRANVSGT